MKRIILTLFLLLCMKSEEAIPQGPVRMGPIEQIQTMIARQGCESLILTTGHIMRVNQILNQQDPASMMLVQRTLSLYLDVVQGQCKKIGKGGLNVIAR